MLRGEREEQNSTSPLNVHPLNKWIGIQRSSTTSRHVKRIDVLWEGLARESLHPASKRNLENIPCLIGCTTGKRTAPSRIRNMDLRIICRVNCNPTLYHWAKEAWWLVFDDVTAKYLEYQNVIVMPNDYQISKWMVAEPLARHDLNDPSEEAWFDWLIDEVTIEILVPMRFCYQVDA